MQGMTRAFNDETVAGNLYRFMGDEAKVLGRWLVLVDGSELDEGNK